MIRESSTVIPDKNEIISDVSDFYKQSFAKGKRKLNQLFPSIDNLQKKYFLTKEELLSVMKEYSSKGNAENNIYRYYSGSFGKDVSIKSIPVKRQIKKAIVKPIVKQENEVSSEPVDRTNSPYNKIMFFIFKIIIGVVGLAFVYIGIKYNFYGNMKNFENSEYIDAFICAFAFMLMSIICLEVFIFFFLKKKLIYLLFVAIYIILFLYNTGTILYYKYDIYQKKNIFSYENIQTKKDLNIIVEIKNKISDLEKKKADTQLERDRQFAILQSLDRSDKEYAFYYWNINSKNGLDAKINIINADLLKARDEKIKIESGNSGIFQSEKKELFSGIVLLIYLFLPSFAIEFLASICLALLLFVRFK